MSAESRSPRVISTASILPLREATRLLGYAPLSLLAAAALLPSATSASLAAESTAPVSASTTAIRAGWVSEGGSYRCHRDGRLRISFRTFGKPSWEQENPHPPRYVRAWMTPDGTRLARAEFESPVTRLRYYDGSCRLLFDKKLDSADPHDDEIFELHLPLGGARILLATSDTEPKDVEYPTSQGFFLLLTEEGREMLRLGIQPNTFNTINTNFYWFQGDRYVVARISPSGLDPQTGRVKKNYDLFIDIAKGQSHRTEINRGMVDVSTSGKITYFLTDFSAADGPHIRDEVIQVGPGHQRWSRTIYEYQFP